MSEHSSRRQALRSMGLTAFALAAAPTVGRAAAETIMPAPQQTPYALPPLPYPSDALEPVLSKEILTVHHDKHHAGYVRGLNKALDALSAARDTGDMTGINALSRDLAFNGSGHVLHSLYWTSMTPGGAALPAGALADAIKLDFASLDNLKAQFTSAAKAVEGSGWAVLGYEPLGTRLLVLEAEKHQNLTVWGITPILVCDVWEHAYYLQYENRRGDYVDAFWKIIDWPAAAARFASAIM